MALSILANFDDLRRCDDILTDGTAEIEFRRYIQIQEEGRLQWQATTAEAQRLQRELDKCAQERADLETKLFHARRLLEMESKARRAAEIERDTVDKKMSQVCDFLRNDRDINDETRNKLAFLNMSSRKRKSKTNNNKYVEDKYGNDINSTGSFLSDLSVTQSEDDFLDVNVGHPKQWKKHRPSATGNNSFADVKNTRRSAHKSAEARRSQKNTSIIDLDGSEKIVATTKVSIPQGVGPIQATSVIEAIPQQSLYDQYEKTESAEQPYEKNNGILKKEKIYSPPMTPSRRSMKFQEEYHAPSAPPLNDVTPNPKFLLNLQGRQHAFTSKTFLRSDTCSYCLKRIRFGTIAMKCRNCRICVHPDCKLQLAMACVPKSQGTPTLKGGQMGIIADYAPSDGPMVPGLIVHCVNEIETRGLSEEGIYRVSGSDKEIKALKERFLRGKTIPPLSNIEIHVICGCVKDFLRHLREPLIPTHLWKDFANAVQKEDDTQAVREVYMAINRLTQANRDTLAFLIQHLQRVASCPAVKMPISNLSKIFGPTILGYSSLEPDQHAIFTETMIQTNVMEHLLNIPTDYWARFINTDSSDTQQSERDSNKTPSRNYFGTPTMRSGNTTLRKDRKFFATPPYSAKRK